VPYSHVIPTAYVLDVGHALHRTRAEIPDHPFIPAGRTVADMIWKNFFPSPAH
jgi:hypothetical protein